MLERDLQDYLYDNPSVLFPQTRILSCLREAHVEGKRIDLLFETEDGSYIVELKAVPLTREHIGQVFEYYGLLRKANTGKKYKMILVSPSIPEPRKVLLEEIGVRCVEIKRIPAKLEEIGSIQEVTRGFRERDAEESHLSTSPLRFEDFAAPATKSVLSTSHRVLRDTSASLQKIYCEYVLVPIRMTNAASHDLICMDPSRREIPFSRGGVWWAYNFGKTEQMPKNDVPNVSAVGMPWGLDLTINAELTTSQAVLRNLIARNPARFDELVTQHGNLQLQMILKLERQPRFYFWIRLLAAPSSSWTAETIFKSYDQLNAKFADLRAYWVSRIRSDRSIASEAQVAQLESRNRRLNLAIRFARPFGAEDAFWRLSYSDQCGVIVNECRRLKPLIEFFR